jgi:hypothetical protein
VYVRGENSFSEIKDLRGRCFEIGEVNLIASPIYDRLLVNLSYVKPPELVTPGSKKDDNTYALSSFTTDSFDDAVVERIKNIFFGKLAEDYLEKGKKQCKVL